MMHLRLRTLGSRLVLPRSVPTGAAAAAAATAAAPSLAHGVRELSSVPGEHRMQKVGVVGLGLMGHGIVQTAAEKGFDVVAVDMNSDVIDKAVAAVNGSMSKLASKAVSKGLLSEEEAESQRAAASARISTSTDTQSLADCDLVIEAIVENLDIKKGFFADLGRICKPDAILASNTSSFPITQLGDASGRPEQVVGLHFFNPVQLMKLVEVVRTEKTSDDSFDRAFAFGTALGKTAVKCKDTPGFIVNRLLVPFLAQAISMVERGDATPQDVDLAMRLGAGHPMGPCHLADYVGQDINLAILEGWKKMFPDNPDYQVPELLKTMNAEGKLGRKTGQGFYKWDGNKIAK